MKNGIIKLQTQLAVKLRLRFTYLQNKALIYNTVILHIPFASFTVDVT